MQTSNLTKEDCLSWPKWIEYKTNQSLTYLAANEMKAYYYYYYYFYFYYMLIFLLYFKRCVKFFETDSKISNDPESSHNKFSIWVCFNLNFK